LAVKLFSNYSDLFKLELSPILANNPFIAQSFPPPNPSIILMFRDLSIGDTILMMLTILLRTEVLKFADMFDSKTKEDKITCVKPLKIFGLSITVWLLIPHIDKYPTILNC
jgi:hypothetical protein